MLRVRVVGSKLVRSTSQVCKLALGRVIVGATEALAERAGDDATRKGEHGDPHRDMRMDQETGGDRDQRQDQHGEKWHDNLVGHLSRQFPQPRDEPMHDSDKPRSPGGHLAGPWHKLKPVSKEALAE